MIRSYGVGKSMPFIFRSCSFDGMNIITTVCPGIHAVLSTCQGPLETQVKLYEADMPVSSKLT